MQKTIKNTIDLLLKIKEALVVIAAVFLWVLGIWLSGRLAPLADDIKTTQHRVNAFEVELEAVQNNCLSETDDLDKKVDNLDRKIDENFKSNNQKLDNIYQILIKEL